MTAYEVEWFANHKYGDNVYLIETADELRIFTAKSKWRIMLNDKHRFGQYTLFHLNHNTDRVYYHKQCEGFALARLVYYAICHDLDIPNNYAEFSRLYDMYKLGREIEESVAIFNFLSED